MATTKVPTHGPKGLPHSPSAAPSPIVGVEALRHPSTACFRKHKRRSRPTQTTRKTVELTHPAKLMLLLHHPKTDQAATIQALAADADGAHVATDLHHGVPEAVQLVATTMDITATTAHAAFHP